MAEIEFLDLDTEVRWGNTIHGLLAGGYYDPELRAHGQVWPLKSSVFGAGVRDRYAWGYFGGWGSPPMEERYSTHLLKVPGIEPLSLPPEEIASEGAEARTWLHYALICGPSLTLHGQPLEGWVCIDPAGGRWYVKPSMLGGSVNIETPLTLTLEVRPFGYLDEAPVAPVSISTTLADLGQFISGQSIAGDPYVQVRVASIASHGRQVVYALYPGTSLTQRSLPVGWLLLRLEGDGPEFVPVLQVLHSRAETLGTHTTEAANSTRLGSVTLSLDYNVSGPDQFGVYTVTASATGAVFVQTGSSSTPWRVGERVDETARKGRLCSVVFSDADVLVRTTADVSWHQVTTFGSPRVQSTSGPMTIQLASQPSWTTANPGMTVQLVADGQEVETIKATVYRDGMQVDSAEWQKRKVIAQRASWGIVGPFSVWHTPPQVILGTNMSAQARVTSVAHTLSAAGAPVFDWTSSEEVPYSSTSSPPAISTGAVGFSAELSGNTRPHTHAEWALNRLSNHVLASTWELSSLQVSDYTQPGKRNWQRAYACQATLDNQQPQTPQPPAGTYNPFTHELVVNGDTSLGRPFVFI